MASKSEYASPHKQCFSGNCNKSCKFFISSLYSLILSCLLCSAAARAFNFDVPLADAEALPIVASRLLYSTTSHGRGLEWHYIPDLSQDARVERFVTSSLRLKRRGLPV